VWWYTAAQEAEVGESQSKANLGERMKHYVKIIIINKIFFKNGKKKDCGYGISG
jgi:hypothetical protein